MDISDPVTPVLSSTSSMAEHSTPSSILFLANPISGGGRSLKIHRQILPQLSNSAVKFELKKTERAGHAFELARDCDVTQFSAIVIIGGDGMFHEVINGLRARADSAEAFKKLTLGAIPAGTGNGLAMSFGFGRSAEIATKAIVENTISPLDLLVVKTLAGEELATGALSVSWGFIADHDNLTENKYRWMGPSVATSIAPIVCLLEKTLYRGTISFIPVGPVTSARGTKLDTDGEWVSITGDFWGFTACNTTHLATDCNMAPAAKINSGSMELVIMHACGYLDMIGLLTGLEEGKHVTHPFIDIFEVKSLKLVPEKPEKGLIAIDGELSPAQPIVVDVLSSGASVYANLSKNNE